MINSYKDIQGWFDFEALYFQFVALLPYDKESNILEIGTWLGKSTCFLGEMIKVSGKPIKIWAVDTFKGEDTCQFHLDEVAKHGGSIKHIFLKNIEDLSLQNIICGIESESINCIEKIPIKFFDIIFIDADHKYNAVKQDIHYFYQYVKNGGIIAGHDYEHDVKKAVDEFAEANGLKVNRLGMCWVIQKFKNEI